MNTLSKFEKSLVEIVTKNKGGIHRDSIRDIYYKNRYGDYNSQKAAITHALRNAAAAGAPIHETCDGVWMNKAAALTPDEMTTEVEDKSSVYVKVEVYSGADNLGTIHWSSKNRTGEFVQNCSGPLRIDEVRLIERTITNIENAFS